MWSVPLRRRRGFAAAVVSGTEIAYGDPSLTSGARVAWDRGCPSQAAGKRRIAYVRPVRRSPSPAHQRAFQSSGDGAGWSMRGVRSEGDNFIAAMVNEYEMPVGMMGGRPQVAPTQLALCVPDVRMAQPLRRRGDLRAPFSQRVEAREAGIAFCRCPLHVVFDPNHRDTRVGFRGMAVPREPVRRDRTPLGV